MSDLSTQEPGGPESSVFVKEAMDKADEGWRQDQRSWNATFETSQRRAVEEMRSVWEELGRRAREFRRLVATPQLKNVDHLDPELEILRNARHAAFLSWQRLSSDLKMKAPVPIDFGSASSIRDSLGDALNIYSHRHFVRTYIDYQQIVLVELYASLPVRIDPVSQSQIISKVSAFVHNHVVTRDHCVVLIPFLNCSDPTIAQVALEAIEYVERRLHQPDETDAPAESIFESQATVLWADDDVAVVQFQHPAFGTAEREFALSQLPVGIADGDSFILRMELDEESRVRAYYPHAANFLAREPEAWESIPEPKLPENLDDNDQMKKFEAETLAYMDEVLPMRVARSREQLQPKKKTP